MIRYTLIQINHTSTHTSHIHIHIHTHTYRTFTSTSTHHTIQNPYAFWVLTGFMITSCGLLWRRLLTFVGKNLERPLLKKLRPRKDWVFKMTYQSLKWPHVDTVAIACYGLRMLLEVDHVLVAIRSPWLIDPTDTTCTCSHPLTMANWSHWYIMYL